jgi:hypothetical protein
LYIFTISALKWLILIVQVIKKPPDRNVLIKRSYDELVQSLYEQDCSYLLAMLSPHAGLLFYRNCILRYLNFLLLIIVNFDSSVFIAKHDTRVILKMANLRDVSSQSVFTVDMRNRLASFEGPHNQLITRERKEQWSFLRCTLWPIPLTKHWLRHLSFACKGFLNSSNWIGVRLQCVNSLLSCVKDS